MSILDNLIFVNVEVGSLPIELLAKFLERSLNWG